MKYIQKRDDFRTGLIKIEENQKLILEKGDWKDSYDDLPFWKDSFVGRLFNFVWRKGAEKVSSIRINKLINDLEHAINSSVIEDASSNEKVKEAIEKTEKTSTIRSVWERIKLTKTKKDFNKIKDEVDSSDIEIISESPIELQAIYNYIDILVNTKELDKKSVDEPSSVSKTDNVKADNVKTDNVKTVSTTQSKNFINDLLVSKNFGEFLKDGNIKKQFFLDIKSILSSKEYSEIFKSYCDVRLLTELSKLSIFGKNITLDAGKEDQATVRTTSLTQNITSQPRLDKQKTLKDIRQKAIQTKGTLRDKPDIDPNRNDKEVKTDPKDLSGNIDKLRSKSNVGVVTEGTDAINVDTLSLRDDYLKMLISSISKFLNDKRFNKAETIKKLFAKVNSLYNQYFSSDSTKPAETDKEEKIVSDEDIKKYLPVVYKDLSKEELDEFKSIMTSTEYNEETGVIKLDNEKIKDFDKKISEETDIKKVTDAISKDPDIKKTVEESTKNCTIDPIEIVRIFNRANKLMIVNRMPSNRSEGKVSDRAVNDYETLDGGSPNNDNSNGPYRNKNVWDKWNDGVLSLIKKYKSTLDSIEEIQMKDSDSYGYEKKTVSKKIRINLPIVKFMTDMLNDSKATGGKSEARQKEFLDKYFNIGDDAVKDYEKKMGGIFNKDLSSDDKSEKVEKMEVTKSNSPKGIFSDKNAKTGDVIKAIVLYQMRTATTGYAFSFQGYLEGLEPYSGKTVTLYCVGIKTFGKDDILIKFSIQNDWFVNAYCSEKEYKPETDESNKKRPVYLMLVKHKSVLKNDGVLPFNVMKCLPGDKIQDGEVFSARISKIGKLKILQGEDNLMMPMDSINSSLKSPGDIIYKNDTMNNIHVKLSKGQ